MDVGKGIIHTELLFRETRVQTKHYNKTAIIMIRYIRANVEAISCAEAALIKMRRDRSEAHAACVRSGARPRCSGLESRDHGCYISRHRSERRR